jgi:UDP-N-acetylmuramoylalanine--D-glutamate ligase
VVEASSFQLESTVDFHPTVAVFLNFSPDHLDRHPSVEDYAAAKARIFANQVEGDVAVINADDSRVVDLARAAAATVVRFSATSRSDVEVGIDGPWIVGRSPGRAVTPLVPLAAVRLIGRHLLADVVAAVAVARVLEVPAPAMIRAVSRFTGLEHALEPVAVVGGVRFVNDSKATNLDAARQAVESFGAGLVVILGGRFKGGDVGPLAAALKERGAAAVLIGESAPLFREALEGRVRLREAVTIGEAVRAAYEWASPAGVVLLAPACASFDMFRDYAERGRAFKAEVARLASRARGNRER